jgi:hypothetical protein
MWDNQAQRNNDIYNEIAERVCRLPAKDVQLVVQPEHDVATANGAGRAGNWPLLLAALAARLRDYRRMDTGGGDS